ncbi:hypothetical protein [Leucobacter chironomi]|uniref:hypothetical protein n=1 Tax=Leucobacter chironomi TaxID=491918 RepID=UPI0003FBBABB|nr:hypothetical protein [Leucobacter chironomi]
MPILKRDRSQRGTWWTLARRRWAYGVLVAAGGVALTYGLMTPDQIGSMLVLGAALLSVTGLAVAHPTRE